MKIGYQTITQTTIQDIQKLISTNPGLSRSALSRQVCKKYDWRKANGKFKDVSCRVKLLKMHRKGLIRLPAPMSVPGNKARGKDRQESKESEPTPIECKLKEIGEIRIVRIGSSDSKDSKIWNTLMDQYHYLGNGPLCGAQMRYLIQSARYGWLGGFSFSAAAWSGAARDQWIGWDKYGRQKNLEKVICNSRFLILPHIRIKHLASHVLSLCVKRLASDWTERYGYEPVLLETYVERDRFKGTSYRAANWTYVGMTHGRSRQDRNHEREVPVKDIYLLELRPDARKILCEKEPEPIERFEDKDITLCDWAEEEFGKAQFGDERRLKRLLTIARDFYEQPQANIPQRCRSRAKTKAAYRFLEHKETRMEGILKSHYEATLSRIGKEKLVLAAQDTTSLNYSTHPATENLGLIGSSADGLIGLIVHDTMVFNLEGTPLGLLNVQCWARDPALFGKKHLRHELPIEEKESNKWLASFSALAQAQKRCPSTRFVSVGDREADIYELFELALRDKANPLLLVRAKHNRALVEDMGYLWDHIEQLPSNGIQEIHVPRKGSQGARTASLEVRFSRVELTPPKGKRHLKELTVWAVLAEEAGAPEGITPLKWMLLTTHPVNSFETAAEMLKWYCLRWGIEVYHRTLKSGCKIEQRQLGSADRLEACLAIDMVIAWRIFYLTKLGRETPDVPCTVFFEDEEWKALVAYKTQNAIPPKKPPTLREATRMVASLGGFLGRKGDGEPGTQTIWLGLQRLGDIAATWKISILTFAPHLLSPPVSSNDKYG